MSRPLKPFRTYEEQLQLLKDKGMRVEDDTLALDALRRLNYYRFTGYAFHYRKGGKDRYAQTCTFNMVLGIYDFDRKFRLLLFSVLEQIEISARTLISYNFSMLHGPDGHYDASNFRNPFYHIELLQTLQALIEKNKNAAFVNHHIQKYDSKMPLWCAVEILSFSALSKMYSNMLDEDKDFIAKETAASKSRPLSSWLHGFSVLRNLCAHYGRIYNTFLSPQVSIEPRILRAFPCIQHGSILTYLISMFQYLQTDIVRDVFMQELTKLLEEYDYCINLGLLGLPAEWADVLHCTT